MITAIEYVITNGEITQRLAANKAVNERDKWHLATIDGNGLPGVSALGSASYGLAGKSFTGISVDARTMSLKLYADAVSPYGLQEMLNKARAVVSAGYNSLGYLRLCNQLGEWYRIAARCTDFRIEKMYRKTALVRLDVSCPYSWFEDDSLQVAPWAIVSGGKTWPLKRPYTFATLGGETTTGGQASKTLTCVNNGDVPAPLAIRVVGTTFRTVYTGVNYVDTYDLQLNNLYNTEHSEIVVSSDPENLGAWFEDGTSASPYMAMGEGVRLSNMVLNPGYNTVKILALCTKLNTALTQIEWRGRYSTCL